MIQPSLNRSRNDKFILVLDLPLALKKQYDSITDKFFSIDPLQLSVFGSPVPQISVPALSVPFGGQVHKVSSMARPEYNPLNIKFLVDNGYKNYWTLWNWLNLFNDAQKSSTKITKGLDLLNSNSKDPIIQNPVREYVSIFTIYGLDEYNNKVISFEYSNAFPTNLSELNFSNQDPSEISCSVTFAFNQLKVNLVSSSCGQTLYSPGPPTTPLPPPVDSREPAPAPPPIEPPPIEPPPIEPPPIEPPPIEPPPIEPPPIEPPPETNIFNVTNNGSGNYVINEGVNPTLTLAAGQTYTFNIIALGHPFWIKTTQTTGTADAYNIGVTNNGTANGTITFVVPFNAPSILYYNCEIHSSMRGIINITGVSI